MWMRMLSTDTSMRFFILGSILAFGPPHPFYMNACEAPKARSGGSGERFGDPGGPDPGEAQRSERISRCVSEQRIPAGVPAPKAWGEWAAWAPKIRR